MVGSYNELTEEQLRRVMPLVLQLKNLPDSAGFDSAQPAESLQFLILDELLEICGGGCYADLAWLWNSKLVRKPFERVKVAGEWCYLPAPNYADTTGVELALCNMYYLRFATSGGKDNKALGNLLAVICRPLALASLSSRLLFGKLRSDAKAKREEFDSARCENRAAGFLDLPLWQAYSILQFWEGMNEQFLEIYATVFEGDDGEKPLFENGEGWIAVLEDIARDGVHGDFERVCGTNVHTLWLYLKHCKIKSQQK